MTEASNADQAISEFDKCEVDLLLIDLDTHRVENGFVPQVREWFPRLPILIPAPSDDRHALVESLHREECRLVLGAERAMIPVVVGFLQDCAEDFWICQQRDSFQLAAALEEALT